MRGGPFRAGVTLAVCAVSALLLACPIGRLRVRIPDFVTSDVRGLFLFRVDDTSGQLVAAGSIEFLGLEQSERHGGEVLIYRQRSAANEPSLGPLRTPVVRDPEAPAALELQLAFLNPLAPGWFKVASYNAVGASRPSTSQTFVATDPASSGQRGREIR
jgi:hypothetical protein